MNPRFGLSLLKTNRLVRTFKKKVIVGMSGGVDSSVTALLLKQQNYEVEGWYMKNWSELDETGFSVCPLKDDYNDVKKVCKQLDIPCKQIPFEREYWTNVFTPCLDEYMTGNTPNPDVYCNREIKFNVFLKKALKECDFVATGHYCQLASSLPLWEDRDANQFPRLLRGEDPSKDQSYFLCEVPGSSFTNVLFPVGHLTKKEVRHIAEQNGLVTAKKKDSFGICFVGERNMNKFLSEYITMKPGDICTYDQQVIGHHNGLYTFTIGQSIHQGGLKQKYFVVDKDIKENKIIVAPSFHSSLYTQSLFIKVEDFHWVDEKEPFDLHSSNSLHCEAVSRYHQSSVPCTVEKVKDPVDPQTDLYKLTFEKYVRAITPGQICALYFGKVCLGGGKIFKKGKTVYEEGYDGLLTDSSLLAN